MDHFFAVFLIQFVSSKMHSFVCETFNAKSNYKLEGRGGGQVVNIFAFYINNQSSNPAQAYNFFCKICV